MEVRVRHATEEDFEALAALVVRANATYREWADAGWTLPGIAHERLRWREQFDDTAAWMAVAVEGGELLGCVSFTDARRQDGRGRPIPRLAHLSRMFVDPANWGRGIGSLRFYERHAWHPGEETRGWHGLVLTRYSLEL